MYYFGVGAPQNYSEARAWCLNAAAFDVCEAQSLLGRIYANGYGVSQNFQRAADWFRKAADQESAADQCALGVLYAHGAGVPQGDVEAAAWFKRAASKGMSSPNALFAFFTLMARACHKLFRSGEMVQKSAERPCRRAGLSLHSLRASAAFRKIVSKPRIGIGRAANRSYRRAICARRHSLWPAKDMCLMTLTAHFRGARPSQQP